ncbi:Lactonase, 7-bladed beta-propeller-domain-containing protein [Scenedesmus sp. NREL 46B-D3]|nr:Lactonase, 7-bladed beta-propeller-domain-containing protein [Scenedesmus sp. NREL 46B-D3]
MLKQNTTWLFAMIGGATAAMAAGTVSSSAGHRVIIGGLGHNSSICLAHLNTKTGHLSISDSWAKTAGPSPAFMAWSSSSSGSGGLPVRNILIANHAGSNGEAITAMQLYPPYAKRCSSVKTDDPCHISLHPSGRWAATASYDAGTVGIVELMPAPQAVEVSHTSPAAALLAGQQQQQQQEGRSEAVAAAGAEDAGVFLPAELQLGRVTTYPTELVGAAAHEAKFSPDGSLLYVPCLKSDWVRMFKFDAQTGKLTPNSYLSASSAAAAATAGFGPVAAAGELDSANPAAELGLAASLGTGGSSDSNTTAAPAAASAAAVPPTAAHAQVAGSSSSGDNRALLPDGSGPRHIVFHPKLPVAYVFNELSSTIARFDWDSSGSSSGLLTADFDQQPDRIVSTLPPGTSADSVCIKYGMSVVAGSNPPGDIACTDMCRPYGGAELALSNDGRFLYASNRGLCEGTPAAGKSSIVVFAVDGVTGALTALDWRYGGGDVQHPRHFSLTPDEANAYLLVANMNGASVTVFRRDSSSGLLSKVATVSTAGAGVQQPAFVAVI